MDNNYLKIPVVIPSLEPDERFLNVVDSILDSGIENLIVVNDGSSNEYEKFYDYAQKRGAIVLRHAVNLGKGRALKTAFNYIVTNIPEAIGCVTADSDGQHTTKDIIHCMEVLYEEKNKLILGCRDFNSPDVPSKSRMGNKITCKVCSALCGVSVSDTQTGLRGIPKIMMMHLMNVAGERFEFETRMLLETKDRWDICEIIIDTVYDSKDNHSTHFNPVKDSIRIYRIFLTSFIKFIFSSLTSCVIDLLLFSLFCNQIKDNSQITYYVMVATICARVISAIYNYCMNRIFVFGSKGKISTTGFQYFMLAVCQMLLSGMGTSIGTWIFKQIPEVGVKIVVDGVLFCLSYKIQQKYIFKRTKK